MGFFKKVTKSISKAVNKVTKAAKAPAKMAAGALGAGAAEVPEVTQEAATPGAVAVEAPQSQQTDVATGESEADKKRTRSSGKKSLSVARSSGAGINI